MRSTIGKIILLLILLYLFFYSIILLGSALKFFGKDFIENIISATDNPLVGLFIGILATSIIQSSSTTTSIVVAMVGGGMLTLSNGIPIIMGANIGTSITNTLISIGHISRRSEFRKAVEAAFIHDFFNVLTVIVILPIQYYTNFLGRSAQFLAGIFEGMGGMKFSSPIQTIVNPLVTFTEQVTGGSGTLMVIIALLCIFIVLRYFSKLIKTLIASKVEVFFNQVIFRTYFGALLFSAILTAIVQSSSITTSLIVPLAGAGILTLRQIYPYTLGANMGTTITAILASLSMGNISAVTIAIAHLLFNIVGITIFTPLKSVPLYIAEKFAQTVEKSRLIPILYIVIMFFGIPLLIIYFN